MDPLTHGLLGGCAAQAALRRRADLPLAAAGVFGGLAPDLDFLIRSSQDPTLTWVFHRHFTHSLLFIPVGGLLVAALLWIFYRRRYRFRWVFIAATVGYATHGLLDTLTSYGTLLYWPFSHARVAWDILPVLDPLFTFLLFLGFLGSLWRRNPLPAWGALLAVSLYTLAAFGNHHRGMELQQTLARRRGQAVERGRVLPSLGNIRVWRSLYESGGKIYVDGLYLPLGKAGKVWEGEGGDKFVPEDFAGQIPPLSPLSHDLNRVRWFSDGYLVLLDRETGVMTDTRYGPEITRVQGFWGVRIDWRHPQRRVQKVRFRFSLKESLNNLWREWRGKDPLRTDTW